MENKNRSFFSRLAELTLVCSIVIPLILVLARLSIDPCAHSVYDQIFEFAFYLCVAIVIISFTGFIYSFINKSSLLIKLELIFSFIILIIFLFIFLVFASSGRYKCQDASIKSNLEGLRTAAELWYDGNDYSYEDACNNADFQRISSVISSQRSLMRCFDSAIQWCAEANLVQKEGEWCADSTGYAGSIANCSAENIGCKKIMPTPTPTPDESEKFNPPFSTLDGLEICDNINVPSDLTEIILQLGAKEYDQQICFIDLDGDPLTEEATVKLVSSSWCGATGNCPHLIYQKTNGKWKEIFSSSGGSISVEDKKTDGYYNIIINGRVGMSVEFVRYKWDISVLKYLEGNVVYRFPESQ